MSSAAGGIAALVSQIQDRSNRLSSEEAVLELLQAEQTEQQEVLEEAKRACAQVRKEFLSTESARHCVELELWQVEGKKQECIGSMDILYKETKALGENKERLQSGWAQLVNDSLVDHQLKREIYQHSVDASIGQREELMKKRNAQFESLATRIATFRNKELAMDEEMKGLKEKLETFKQTKEGGDEELSRMSLEVKEMLAKRSNLRKNLRGHKKAFEEANEATLKWENECVELVEAETRRHREQIST